MTPPSQIPGDVGQLVSLLQTIKDQMGSQKSGSSLTSMETLQMPLALPSKEYGSTTVSGQAQAVLGDVIYFDNRDQEEQRLILKELTQFRQQMEIFYQRQDRRDENMQQALYLITEINHSLRSKSSKSSKSSTSETNCYTIPGQQLLSMVKPVDGERCADMRLEFCLSLVQRRQSQLTFVKPTAYMSKINQWLHCNGSVLLNLTARAPAAEHMSDILVQLAAMLKDSGNLVIWSLPLVSEESNIRTIIWDIVSQFTRFQPDFAIKTNFIVTPTMLEAPLKMDLWIEILCAVLASIQKGFLVLNLFEQPFDTSENEGYCTRLIAAVADSVDRAEANGNVVKVLVYTNSTIPAVPTLMQDSEKRISCFVDAVPTNIASARRLSTNARSLARQSLLTPVLSID